MNRYDPHQAPDPKEWNELDETERIDEVLQYHKHNRIRLPNAVLHATFHVIVENQTAMGDELNVARTLKRLMSEGLDRHEALHAIGFVLSNHMCALMNGTASAFSESLYASELESLTLEKWRQQDQSSS